MRPPQPPSMPTHPTGPPRPTYMRRTSAARTTCGSAIGAARTGWPPTPGPASTRSLLCLVPARVSAGQAPAPGNASSCRAGRGRGGPGGPEATGQGALFAGCATEVCLRMLASHEPNKACLGNHLRACATRSPLLYMLVSFPLPPPPSLPCTSASRSGVVGGHCAY